MGVGLMLISSAWVFLVTGLIQPSIDASLSDRFLQEKFGHLVEDVSGGTWSVLFQMLQKPVALLQSLGQSARGHSGLSYCTFFAALTGATVFS